MANWTTPVDWSVGELVTAAKMIEQIKNNLLALSPVGQLSYVVRAATTTETLVNAAWLECNGVAVSRTTYVDLFNLLNALSPALPFGVGNGSTTFNLPDLSGRTLVALSPTGGQADVTTLGGSDGAALASRRPKHTHSRTGDVTLSNTQPTITRTADVTLSDPGHTHVEHDATSGAGAGSAGTLTTEGTRNTGSSTTGITVSQQPTFSASGGGASVTAQPAFGPLSASPTDAPAYLVAGVWMIKAKL